MCRLVGIVASEATEFGLVLTKAPRCLAALSREHPDGWGLAIHDADAADESADPPSPDPWIVHKGTACAGDDRRFFDLAGRSHGHVLVAHVRQKTVGPTRIENTHPFTRDGWAFAHNGTVHACDLLQAGTSPERLAQIAGDTDSERLFAYLLTRLDEHGLTRPTDAAARDAATAVIAKASADLRARSCGAFNFLLSDGASCFVHRCGRSLYLLERTPHDPVRERRAMGNGAEVVTKWTERRQAILVASERMTDEPWRELEEGTFLRIDRVPVPRVVTGDAAERAA